MTNSGKFSEYTSTMVKSVIEMLANKQINREVQELSSPDAGKIKLSGKTVTVYEFM